MQKSLWKLGLRNANKAKWEIENAEEYNKKYCNTLGNYKNYRKKKSSKPHEVTKYWMSLTEKERIRFSQSYLTFMAYMKAHKRI